MPALALLLPFIFTAVRIFLVANLLGFIVRILAGFGMYFLLLEPAVDQVTGILAGQFGLLPPAVAVWVGFLNIDRFFSLVMSAYIVVATSNFVLRMNRG